MDYQADKQFGANLRNIRDEHGLTQGQLAAMLQVRGIDITRSALAKIEVGQRHIYLDELVMLQKILNVPYDELLNMETAEKP